MAKTNDSAAKTFSFEVDASSDLPLWVQLRNRIAHLIATGYYRPGDQLPTVRALAADISINYNTVNKAYLALKSDGIIESTRGRGAFVKDVGAEDGQEGQKEADTLIDDCIESCRGLGLSLDDIGERMDARILKKKIDEGLVDAPRGRIVNVGAALGNARKDGSNG